MALLNNLGRKASEVTSRAMQKAQDLSETARLNSIIADEEKKINSAYFQIGEKYVEIHGRDGEEAFAEMLAAINESRQKINSCQKPIKDMKEVLHCGTCQAEIPKDSLFCSFCGTRVSPSEEPASEESCRCGRCNAPVTPGMRFCVECGNRYSV